MDVDYKKLLLQEPEFKKYVEEVLLEISQTMPEGYKFFYMMYQAKVEPKKVAEMMRYFR